MTISAELQAQILRYHHVEKWRTGTIARQLGVHHETVARVLTRSGVAAEALVTCVMQIDPYLAFILETIGRFPSPRRSSTALFRLS